MVARHPYSRDTRSSRTANKKFGSSGNQLSLLTESPDREARIRCCRHLACTECPDMNTAKIGIYDLFAVV